MRILRGKSNLEVSYSGFALFVVGFVIATFMGGAFRTILSSDRVHQRIVSELKGRFPKNSFELEATEVLLSRGLWPALGLRLRNVAFRQETCDRLSFQLHVPEAVVPIDLTSLVRGQVKVGRASFLDAKMALSYRDCTKAAPEGPVGKAAAADSSTPISNPNPVMKTGGVRPPKLDWIGELSRVVEQVDLQRFELTYDAQPNWKLIFESAKLVAGKDLQFVADIEVHRSLPFGELVHPVKAHLQVSEQILTWNVHSDYKEGRLDWSGNWEVAGNAAHTDIVLHQVPLKDLTSELYQMGYLEREIRLRTAWLTCRLGWEGQPTAIADLPIKIRECKIEGAYGRVDLAQADYFMAEPNGFRPAAKFQVKKLQLQPLAESLDLPILPAVISKLGAWSGDLLLSDAKDWQLNGALENLEVVFSNQSLRGKQIVTQMNTVLMRTRDHTEVKLSDIRLIEGLFEGQLSGKFTGSGATGEFSADIASFQLSPSIQNLLVGGAISAMKVQGRGRLTQGQLTDWQGDLVLKQIAGEGWTLNNLRVDSKFRAGQFAFEAKADEMVVEPTFHYFAQLAYVRPGVNEPVKWTDLKGRSTVSAGGGNLQSLSALEVGKQNWWRAKGDWVREGEFNGLLSLGGQQVFSLHGEKNQLFVESQASRRF